MPYKKIKSHDNVDSGIDWLLSTEGFCLCEILQDTEQPIEPRIISKKLSDGTMVSPPIDDLAPFLSKDDYRKYSKFT